MPAVGPGLEATEIGRDVQMIPVPLVLPFADSDNTAASDGAPEIVLCDTGVVLNFEPLNAQAFRKSPSPQR
jgi:hypothetical protein